MKCAILIFLFAPLMLVAQGKYFYVSLDVNKPLSNTAWIEDVTARGFRAGYRVFITPRISAGLDLGAATYDQYVPTETRQSENGAVTTDYFNYVYNYNATLSGQYNFKIGDGEQIFPYAGLGVGANHNEYFLYYNIYSESERRWGFLVRPEAGVLVKFSKYRSIGAIASVHYNYSTNSSRRYGYDNFNSLAFQVGLILMEL